jgi:CheY-like chemotaxis protein
MIAEQADGSLATFSDDTHAGYRVLLPAAEVRAGGASRMSLTPIALTGTVLIVEDQPAIFRTMARALSATGLAVLEAGSAEDALAVLDARPQLKLALVVTDVVLPRMSGPHLAEQLRQRYPGLPVLLVSGYVGDDVSAELQSGAATAFVTKPFTGRQLAVRAAALLAQRARSLAPAGA